MTRLPSPPVRAPRLKPKNDPVYSFRLPADLVRALDAYAKRTGARRSPAVVDLLRRALALQPGK